MKIFEWLTKEFTMTQLVLIIIAFVLIFVAGYSLGGIFNSKHTIKYEYVTDTLIQTDVISEVDTFYLPAELDTMESPPVAGFSRKMSGGGFVRGIYTFPPVNRFDIEIKEPKPAIRIKPVIQERIVKQRDIKEYACIGGAGFVAGIIATIITIIKL